MTEATNHLYRILIELCNRASINTNADTVDFKRKDWSSCYYWTIREREQFREWLKIYYTSHRNALLDSAACNYEELQYIDEHFIERHVDEFITQWGWRLDTDVVRSYFWRDLLSKARRNKWVIKYI